jgi:dipeptidyl aminopeptidase/acylaminoacyl peptidase
MFKRRNASGLLQVTIPQLAALTCLVVGGGSITNAAEAPPDYVKHVAPILKKYCAGCHNAEDHDGKLSLESFSDLQKGGEHGPALVPGQAKSSRLIRMLNGAAEPRMPPEDNPVPTPTEVALLTDWIASGAKGPLGAEPDRKTLLTGKIEIRHRQAKGITAMAASPDGKTVALGRFLTVELLSVDDDKLLRTLSRFPGKVNAVHFSADGRQLVTASGITGLYGQAVLWDVQTGKKIREFTAHRDTMFDAELSPDGKVLASCSYDKKIILWNAATGEQLRTLEGHNDAVYDVAFSRDGSVLASASGDETVKVWQVGTGKRLDTLGQPQAEQYAVLFSPDGRYILAGGADNRIRVWRFDSRTEQRINPLVYARFAHEGAVIGLAFSDDGKTLVSTAEDRTLKLWDTADYSQKYLYEKQSDVVTGLAVPTGQRRLLVGRLDGTRDQYALTMSSSPETAPTTPLVVIQTNQPMPAKPHRVDEVEPNDQVETAKQVDVPALVRGVINPTANGQQRDNDLFRFESKAGQQWVIEVNAARQKSPLDSRIEILDEQGKPIERVLLQAVRDSYFTFRGQNSSTADGFRLHNWEEMELNEYLYAAGEVVKLWHYPRGPDSGFMLYPGRGNRFTFFDTTPVSHPLQEPCYIVEPHAPGSKLIPNGLPVFPLYYENDDDCERELGTDSRLTFTAPADGFYVVRLTDTRGFAGPDFKYELHIRPRRPDFKVSIAGGSPTVNAGSAKEFTVNVDRIDGFDGPIEVVVSDLPPGFFATSPIVVQAGQNQALGMVFADPAAPKPTAENAKASKVTARAEVRGKMIERQSGSLGEIKLADKPKLLVRVVTSDGSTDVFGSFEKPIELTIAPGETITAKVIVDRNGFDGRVSFGNADAGRNLPHGVYIDNIGLNGLLVVEKQSERTFFLTAAKWVPETTRIFHLLARVEGNQATLPVILHVRKHSQVAKSQ